MSGKVGERLPRFQVQITAAYPELADDLAQVPPRCRPDRLRTLAVVGLALMRGKAAAVGRPVAAPSAAPEPPADPQLERRLRLLEAISDDV